MLKGICASLVCVFLLCAFEGGAQQQAQNAGSIRFSDGGAAPFEWLNVACPGCELKADLTGASVTYSKTVAQLAGPYPERLPKKPLKGLKAIRFQPNSPQEQAEIGGLAALAGYQCKQADPAKPLPGSRCPVRKLSLVFDDGNHLDDIFVVVSSCCGPTSATGPEERQYDFQSLDIAEVTIGSARIRIGK
jgi:hypothetical protein